MIYPTDNVHRITRINIIDKVRKIDYSRYSFEKLRNLEQYYQQRAVMTNDWFYYKELLEIRKEKRSRI